MVSPRRKKFLILLMVFDAIVIGALVWFFVLRDDAPSEVDLDATRDAVNASDSAGGGADANVDGIAGVWNVDASIGDFTLEDDATASFAGFRIDEELSSLGAVTAVGRTPGVSGTVTIDDTTVIQAEITVDMTGIKSDEGRREGPIQRALATAEHPTATFTLTQPVSLGGEADAGEPVSVEASGMLTVAGRSLPVTFALDAQLLADGVLVVGSTDVLLSDFGLTAPSAPVVVSVSDTATVELQLWLTR